MTPPPPQFVRVLEKTILDTIASTQAGIDASAVKDIVRCMIECDTVEQINAFVAAIVEAHGAGSITVIRVKNRFQTPSAGGWRDIMINFIVAGLMSLGFMAFAGLG